MLLLSWDIASGLTGDRRGERGFIAGRLMLELASLMFSGEGEMGLNGLSGDAGKRGITESLWVRGGEVLLTRG